MDFERYSRQIMLDGIGVEGQERLGRASVCVVGAGGLGCPTVLQLANMGIGRVRIVDRDVVEECNLHRQTLYLESDVGRTKVDAAADRIRERNSSCRVEPAAASINEYSAPGLIEGFDVVVDALDNMEARYALNRACVEAGKPLVSGAAVGVEGTVYTYVPGTSCYECRFPSSEERNPPTCGTMGVHPSVLTITTSYMTREVEGLITGSGASLINRGLYIVLADAYSIDEIKVPRDPECATCVRHERVEMPEILVEGLCGRMGGKRAFSITSRGRQSADMEQVIRNAESAGYECGSDGQGAHLRRDGTSVDVVAGGTAIVVGINDEEEAVAEYKRITAPRVAA